MEEQIETSTTVDASSDAPSDVETVESVLDKLEDNAEIEENPTADETNEEEAKEVDTATKNSDNGINYPDKFKKEDGTLDTEKLLNSYTELESNFTKKTQELNDQIKSFQQQQEQERLNQLKMQGFDSEFDYKLSLELARNLAGNYMQYVGHTQDPQYVQNLLYAYAQKPSQSLLEEIEDNFGVDVIKQVTADNTNYRANLIAGYQAEQQRQYEEKINAEATEYVTNAYNQFPEWFERKEFVDFFGDALKTKGDAFQAAAFVQHVQNIWDLAQKTLLAELKSKNENNSAISSLVGQAPKNSTIPRKKEIDLDNCSESELASAISEFI